MAKILMQAMYRQVQTMINTNSIGPRGEYLHAHVPEVITVQILTFKTDVF